MTLRVVWEPNQKKLDTPLSLEKRAADDPARPSAATKNQGRDAAQVTDAPTHAQNEGNLATDTHGLNTDDLLRCAPARLTLSVFNPCSSSFEKRSVAKNSLY